MKRSKHSLSHYKLLTCDMGRLVPIACYEVLPGDTVQQASSLLIRVSPLVAPVMHPVSVRVHHWFVPHRLVWDGWEDFITGGPDGQGGDAGPYPTATSGPTGLASGSVADYMGVPPYMPDLEGSLLPFRSYNMIYNEFYRDPDLNVEAGDDDRPGVPHPICWEKDYFTSARPWPQKGPDVFMPLGESAPVIGDPAGNQVPQFWLAPSQPTELSVASTSANVVSGGGAPVADSPMSWRDPKLVADLSQATSVNVNDVRLAFALQRYQEARSRYGSRYTEYLRYLGVRPSDARLQRPEYLGGGKQTIAFSEVLQTGPGSTEGSPTPGGVGQMAGHGIAAMRSRRFRRFFEEHGFVISLLSVRPRTMYVNQFPRMFSRRTKEDYWQRELEQIGQQEVFCREVYGQADGAGQYGDKVFGYQDRYSEYKHIQSSIHGEFRDIMDYWHMGRKFSGTPTLNASFVTCDPTKRIHQEQNQHSLWVMCNHSIQARRMVSKSGASRIL